jgi:hypothetical protein
MLYLTPSKASDFRSYKTVGRSLQYSITKYQPGAYRSSIEIALRSLIQRNFGFTNLEGPKILFFIAEILLLQGFLLQVDLKSSSLLQEFCF